MSIDQDYEFSQPAEKWSTIPTNEATSTSILSIVSLASGILAFTFMPIVAAIIAIVTGHAALREIRDSGGRLEGRPMAQAGLWLGYGQFLLILICLGLALLVFLVFWISTVQSVVAIA